MSNPSGVIRPYSDDTFRIKLSKVKYKNDYTIHKARIVITDGNSVFSKTLGNKLITLPNKDQ